MPARRSYRCLYTASPASQNAPWLALRFSFLEDRQFCRVSDARRDRWEHQNEHFVRDFLQFSHFVASKSTFSYAFSLEPENLQPQNRCFVRGFRQFSSQLTKCHACHAKRHDNLRGNLRKGEPQENQRLETRRVGAPKRAFRARLPPIFTLCSCKIDVFLRVFLRT